MDNPCVLSVLIKINYAKQGCDGSVSGWGENVFKSKEKSGNYILSQEKFSDILKKSQGKFK